MHNRCEKCLYMRLQVDVKGTGLEHLVNGSMGKALSVYALNPADKVLGFCRFETLTTRAQA